MERAKNWAVRLLRFQRPLHPNIENVKVGGCKSSFLYIIGSPGFANDLTNAKYLTEDMKNKSLEKMGEKLITLGGLELSGSFFVLESVDPLSNSANSSNPVLFACLYGTDDDN
ncbi:hypothetical protein Taro_005725 [Colocasia esculenta]|uniref:Uncharacterized protein n=1 Tax=Colocasia esculenta TaxID=4460 RepID=A0A843TNZ3_COLES|nr:hypothetical protein [Colocasia esculenta]